MAWLAIQTLINLSAMVVLIPLTGVPFPFISYGGSSLMAALAGIGIYVNALRSRSIERINR
jgi:cell division protein FtsW